jgi:hypothetical protein
MADSKGRSGLIPAYIEAGRIIDVDPVNWRCEVRTEVSRKTFSNCLLSSPYLHFVDGEGIHAMPEVGAGVWVCCPSEPGALCFILGYRPLHDDIGSHAANRELRNPGDMVMVTRDGNGFKAYRGGASEVIATAIARTIWVPIGNLVHTFAENLKFDVFGGNISWLVNREEEDPDGHKGTKFTWGFKEFADDAGPVGKLQAGGQIDVPVYNQTTPVFLLQVFAEGVEEPTANFIAGVDKDGRLTFEVADTRLKLQAGKSLEVFDTDANAVEGVLLSKTYLTDELTFLTGLQTALAAIGVAVPGLPEKIAATTASIAVLPAGGAPYISTRTRTQ